MADPKPNLEILLRELGRRGPDTTILARRCIEAVLADDRDATRRDAMEAIEPLAGAGLSLFSLGSSALLELGAEAAPALKRWILAHGGDAYSLVWATLRDVDAAPGLAAFGELLEAQDERLVAAAAAGVGAAGPAGARYAQRLRELSRSLGDPWLRGQAMAALGRVVATDPETLELLIRVVRDGDDEEQIQAMVGLGCLGPAASEAVGAICEHLADDEILNACEAANALRRIGVRSQRVGDALARALDGEEDSDRYLDLLRAIGELGVPSALAQTALDAALRSPDEMKRAGAMVAAYLARGDPSALRHALSRWRDSDDVLWVLSEWRVPLDAFADDLLRLVQERASAGAGSGRTIRDVLGSQMPPGTEGDGPADGTPYLIALLSRLGERAKAAIPALEQIAADEREAPWTRDGARDALRMLSGSREAQL